MRKLTLFAALAIAAAAFAVPSVASAKWTDNHVHVGKGVNPQLHLQGTVAFTSSFGGIDCTQTTSTIELTGDTTTAHVKEFTPVLASCHTTGGLAPCTITSITTEGLPYLAHANKEDIQITGVKIKNALHGFLCPTTITVSGDGTTVFGEKLKAGHDGQTTKTETSKQTLHSLHLGGELASTVGPPVTVAGTVTPTQAGEQNRYGWT